MLKTALHDAHVAAGARMVDFAGWSMPVVYSSITEEHHAVRNGCGVFDVSHMGRLKLTGKHATDLLNHVCTRTLDPNAVGRCRYSLVCNEHGGTLDDVVVTRFDGHWGMVCNASNREKILAHLHKHAAGRDVRIEDQTPDTVMLAFQGPKTFEYAERLIPFELPALKKWQAAVGSFMFMGYTLYRSGYTGEDGMEAVIGTMVATLGFKQVIGHTENGQPLVRPCGLGARDTLRIEAALPLYGHELSEEIDPLSAGLGWAVQLDKPGFVGQEALARIAANGPARQLIGLELEGRRIARQDTPILVDGRKVGHVTSGTLSPTLGISIAMGLVDRGEAENLPVDGAFGTAQVDLRGQLVPARRLALPFYRRSS